MGRSDVTLHHTGQAHGAQEALEGATVPWQAAVSYLDFSIEHDVTPVEAMERASAMVAMSLPRFLEGVPGAEETCAAAQAVLTELVDVTARHKAGIDLVGRVAFDGHHVTVSVGDMDCPLPLSDEEPGLYLVRRLAIDVGQYAGDLGGRVTWAAVAA